MDGPLAGVRVLELGNHTAAPFAACMLGDFGAEIVKIDQPGRLDHGRRAARMEPEDAERSLYFMTIARNKKSVTLDVAGARGRELFLELVGGADVVLENFRPGTLERWDLGFETLSARNPHLVLLRISGFGQRGPRSKDPGVDRIAQTFAGVTFLTGTPDGPPVKCGVAMADYTAGLLGAYGVVLALRTRDRDRAAGVERTAQLVDVSLYDGLIPMLGDFPERFRRHGEIRQRTGNFYPGTAPGNSYRCADGAWILLAAPGDSLFARLARAVGRSEWLADPRYSTMALRDANRGDLEAGIQAWTGSRDSVTVLAELQAAEIPVSAVNTVADIVADPHIAERGNLALLRDEILGDVLVPAPVPFLTRTPGAIASTAPRVGEHNDEILGRELGLGAEELAQLDSGGLS